MNRLLCHKLNLTVVLCMLAAASAQGDDMGIGTGKAAAQRNSPEIGRGEPSAPLYKPVPPASSSPRVPSPPSNSGAYNPQTGEGYLPSGRGVYNPGTGEYYPPSGSGYINPRTGQYYPSMDHH